MSTISVPKGLVLASTSPYRASLLEQLGLTFETTAPDFDEPSQSIRDPATTAREFACQKARSVSNRFPEHLIIGSDQTASLNEQILTKPGTVENAREQLMLCSGRRVRFYTALALLDSASGRIQKSISVTEVKFRNLSPDLAEAYIQKEMPLDCCGSFKVEGLGIALFESIHGKDPNSLIGLPLIDLITMLKNEGIDVIRTSPS